MRTSETSAPKDARERALPRSRMNRDAGVPAGWRTLTNNRIKGSTRFRAAINAFDAANREDPNREVYQGRDFPKELLYAKRMTAWLDKIAPEAPETVQLAVRAQHIERWKIPRSDYAIDRQGYRKWRVELGKFHAETAGRMLIEAGYDDETVANVQSLLRKESLKADANCQLLEDAACLVFLEFHLRDFAEKHEEEKLTNILRRTWKKMSERGRKAALQLELPPHLGRLVEKAVAG